MDIDDRGIAGVEKYFDRRLRVDPDSLRLSIDIRVQEAVREELQNALEAFGAQGGCAILMDVNTGEIPALVSLPDFDANRLGDATPDSRFNRAVTGLYEPGSTFKLQTAAMALELGISRPGDQYSSTPIRIGRFTISDLKGEHFSPMLSLPEVMAYSSNPAAARIAIRVGEAKQHEWLRRMGFLDRVPVELPEAAHPLVPLGKKWSEITTMTLGFGHGIAESPLAILRGTAATANGGILVTPTLVARPSSGHAASPEGPRVLSETISRRLRKILRVTVTKGIGKRAESPGYYVGGKTGTAEKIGPHGGYLKHVNIAAFTGIFPANRPRYALYVMLDAPHGTPETHGMTTAGWIAAPLFSRIVARTGPLLGVYPDLDHEKSIEASLALPLRPRS